MNLKFEIYNGEFLASGQPIFTSANRGLRYGDGLFESIRVYNGRPIFLNDHLERLKSGMKLLHLQWNSNEIEYDLKTVITEFIHKNEQLNQKLRIIIFRDSSGFYTPASDQVSWHISGESLNDTGYGNQVKGITTGLFDDEVKSKSSISNYKSLNCLVSVLAGVAARDRGWDEALIINSDRNIIESGSSNLFIRKGNSFLTPPLSDGCLDGVMRKNVMILLHQNGASVTEQSLNEKDVLDADEILLTNAIAGVRWVENYKGKMYQNTKSAKINNWLNELTK